MSQGENRRYGARILDQAEQLLPAFNILRLQADAGLRRPSKNINTRATQLAVLLDDDRALRSVVEATDLMIRRRGILRRARTRAFDRAGDRSTDMPDVARALLRLAARSDWDRVDVFITVVSKLRSGLSEDLDAHIDQVLARLAPSLGAGSGSRDYCCVMARSTAAPPSIDLATAIGRVGSVIEPPDWAFDSPRPAPPSRASQPKLPRQIAQQPTASVPTIENVSSLSSSLGEEKWAFIEISNMRGAHHFKDTTLPALPSLDAASFVTQLVRISQLECVRHCRSQR